MKRRVVITGMGGVTPIGLTSAEIWENAKAGVCGIEALDISIAGVNVHAAGQVRNFDPKKYMSPKQARRNARFTQFAMAAAHEAFDQSGLDMTKEDPGRCGVVLSSGIGGLAVIESEKQKGMERGFDKISPLFVPMSISNMAAGVVAIELGFNGACSGVVTACASSTNAIGEAFRMIRHGYADVMAAGGTEACISELGIAGFASMRALSETDDPKRASIPFDADRNGFVMGEGAGVLILEEFEHAKARGAVILGEVAGYASNCDAHHMTAPLEDGSMAGDCIRMAIKDAGIAPAQVGYVNAHGTSTPMNDRCETRAIRNAFGSHAEKLAVSSTKSMTGHLLGASGAIETLVTVCALADQLAPPTAGYHTPDPDCNLNVVPNKAQMIDTEYAVSESFGFGGHNAVLVLRRV